MNRRILSGFRAAAMISTVTSPTGTPEGPARTATGRSGRRGLRMAALGATAALALSACQWSSPITTMMSYDPSDGVSTQIGAVHLNNLLVISPAKGAAGNVVGLAINGTDKPVQLAISTVDAAQGAQPPTLSVPAHATAQLTDGKGTATVIPKVAVPPGATIQLLVSGSAGQTVVEVPVLSAEGYYAKYGPTTPATPVAGSTAPATATATP